MHAAPDLTEMTQELSRRLERTLHSSPPDAFGRVIEVGPTLLKASLPGAALGELCSLREGEIQGEVVAIDRQFALVSPFSEPLGLKARDLIKGLHHGHRVALGDFLQGSIVDGFGKPLSGGAISGSVEYRGLERDAPNPLTRQIVTDPLPLGIRAIDGLLTCGIGQRVGIFAAAGCGKSTLLSMICDGTQADVIVLALVGERGREVREFLEHTLSEEARKKAVVVVATSDRPAIERLKATYTATTIAEYFRDKGQNVLLMVDSLTRFARAAREIGIAAGEPCAPGNFPPSTFARLPKLLERAGRAERGSITGIYTVLVEGDNMNEPLADEVRSILDGHIILSRKLCDANHYPAIDIGASVSRVMPQIATTEHVRLAGKLRSLQACYKDVELLIRVGEYQKGKDPEADEAIAKRSDILAFLRQDRPEIKSIDDTVGRLKETVN